MEIKQEIITMLEMLTQPAFLADEVKIRHVNAAAKMYLLQPDMLLAELLGEHWPVYQSFTGDSLYCRLGNCAGFSAVAGAGGFYAGSLGTVFAGGTEPSRSGGSVCSAVPSAAAQTQ